MSNVGLTMEQKLDVIVDVLRTTPYLLEAAQKHKEASGNEEVLDKVEAMILAACGQATGIIKVKKVLK